MTLHFFNQCVTETTTYLNGGMAFLANGCKLRFDTQPILSIIEGKHHVTLAPFKPLPLDFINALSTLKPKSDNRLPTNHKPRTH